MGGSSLLEKQDYIHLLESQVKIMLNKHLLCKNMHLTSQQELRPLQKCSAKQFFHFAFCKISPRHTWNIYRNSFYSCIKAHTPPQRTAWDTGNKHRQEGKQSASVTETFGTRGLLLVTTSFLSCSVEFYRYFLHRNQTDQHIPTSHHSSLCVHDIDKNKPDYL